MPLGADFLPSLINLTQHCRLCGGSENNMNEETKKALEAATVDGKFLMYKERPLVREGNTIIYGNISDEYILQLIIMNEKEFAGRSVPDKVIIQVMKTDKSLTDGERIVKQELKSGLYEAFELGMIWLERLIGD